MIAVNIAGQRFQMRAAAVIVHDGHVLLHRHEDQHLWPLPGGRVEPGEDAASTVVRAMQEELEEPVESGELLYLAENFFMRAASKPASSWSSAGTRRPRCAMQTCIRPSCARRCPGMQHFPHAMQRG